MLTRLLRRVPSTVAAMLLAPLAGADVTILGQPGTYPTIQGAIGAAQDGAVLLIEPGQYAAGFTIVDKSLTLLPDPPGHVQINGLAAVRDLAPHRSVTLMGLNITAPPSVWTGLVHPGLTLEGNAGHVRLQDCTLRGGRTTQSAGYTTPAGHGLRVIDSPRVFVIRCTLLGREFGFDSGEAPRSGGDGLAATDSGLAIYHSDLRGGVGSDETSPAGGDGGAGLRIEGLGAFLVGSSLRGGNGGGGDYIGCTTSGNGGDALVVQAAQCRYLDSQLFAGLANGFYTCAPGSDGQLVVSSGGVASLPGPARSLVGPMRTTDNATTILTVTGEPGDTVWLLRSRHPDFLFSAALQGVVAVPYPWRISYVPAGVIGAGGSLDVPLTLGDLQGPQPAWTWSVQALVSDPFGAGHLSNPVALVVENT